MIEGGQQNKTILLTGATGFIGRNLVEGLVQQNYTVKALVRRESHDLPTNIQQIVIGDLKKCADFTAYFKDVNIVIHLAGLAHITDNGHQEFVELLEMTNVAVTSRLTEAAVLSGVDRFIFLSSIGVNGNKNDIPFLETDLPSPVEEYAKSKLSAEQQMVQIGQGTDLDIVIIRPPLVYGPNAPGNFGRLVRLVQLGIPLPFGSMNNLRSLCGIENLVDFIQVCIENKNARNELFLIGDADDISTKELVSLIGKSMNKNIPIWNIPVPVLKSLAGCVGKHQMIDKLSSSLQINTDKAQTKLNWTPKYSVYEGIKRATQ